jgi:hypothetical protein
MRVKYVGDVSQGGCSLALRHMTVSHGLDRAQTATPLSGLWQAGPSHRNRRRQRLAFGGLGTTSARPPRSRRIDKNTAHEHRQATKVEHLA